MIPGHYYDRRMVSHPDQHIDPEVAFLDGRLVGGEVAVYHEQICLGLNCVRGIPLEALRGVAGIVIFIHVEIVTRKKFVVKAKGKCFVNNEVVSEAEMMFGVV